MRKQFQCRDDSQEALELELVTGVYDSYENFEPAQIDVWFLKEKRGNKYYSDYVGLSKRDVGDLIQTLTELYKDMPDE